jgi:hypothetical protein
LIWTGGEHTPNGYLRGKGPGGPPPGSFEERLGLLQQWVEEHGSSHVPRGTVYRGAKLRSWMDSNDNDTGSAHSPKTRPPLLRQSLVVGGNPRHPAADQATRNLSDNPRVSAGLRTSPWQPTSDHVVEDVHL